MNNMAKHPSETPKYWLEHARNERAFAAAARKDPRANVESIAIYLRNAAEYEATAAKIAAANAAKEG